MVKEPQNKTNSCMISGAGAACREPVGVDIIVTVEQHPPGKFELLMMSCPFRAPQCLVMLKFPKCSGLECIQFVPAMNWTGKKN